MFRETVKLSLEEIKRLENEMKAIELREMQNEEMKITGTPEIVLITIGNFQDYILDNITNIYQIHTRPSIKPIIITVITNQRYFQNLENHFRKLTEMKITNSDNQVSDIDIKLNLIDCDSLDDLGFNKSSRMDKTFRNGFWHLCKLRLVYLYSYMHKHNRTNIIHIENDVMIYTDLYTLINELVANINTKLGKREKIRGFPNKLLVPFDCAKRAIISIMFIPYSEILLKILDKTLNNHRLNDMEIIPQLFSENEEYRRMIGLLPIAPLELLKTVNNGNNHLIKYAEYMNEITPENDKCACGWSVFDAAGIGQYLGGVDPRNIPGDSRGFINETCIVKYNHVIFKWFISGGLYRPYLEYNYRLYPVNNLHIHSKKLNTFMAQDPSEVKLIRKPRENEMLDIVVVLGPNDINIIEYNLKYNRANVLNARNIYIVSPAATLSAIKPIIDKLNSGIMDNNSNGQIILIDEAIFPISMSYVNKTMASKNRDGWYLQQVLKLYCGRVIPDMLDNYLVIDTDTLFTKPTHFITTLESSELVFLFNHGTEYNRHYFLHMAELHPSLVKLEHNKSGICHHMIFNRQMVEEMLVMVETHHGGKPFWEIFIEKAVYVRDKNNGYFSCASEYEMYFNFMLAKHPNQIKIRKINYYECSRRHIVNRPKWQPDNSFNYYCFHHYI